MNEPLDLEQRFLPLSTAYGKPRLVCLVKNPNWVFVFWEIGAKQIEESAGTLHVKPNELRKVLRVYQTNGEKREIISDITIKDEIGFCYVHLHQSGCNYQLELAVSSGDSFMPLLTSNFAFVPPDDVSDQIDETWATIDELYNYYLSSSQEGAALSSPLSWTMSSPMAKQPQEIHPELEVHTELVLYGKVTAGSQVYIQGEPVNTNLDGTFSIRYMLENGSYVYPVKAVTESGQETKTVVPVITKETY